MPEPLSDEVRAMEQSERKRWLTVAEAQKLRRSWDSIQESIGKATAKFDEDPEAESEAMLFIVMAALLLHGFMREANQAAKRLNELAEDAK